MLKIGDAAQRSGMPSKTIRYYEDIGLIGPADRLDNSYRAYGESDVRRLRFIHQARGLGFSLKDIAALLELYGDRERASHEVKQLALRHVATLDAKIAQMMAIRKALAELADRRHGDDRPECPILDELASGGDPKVAGVRGEDDFPPNTIPRPRQRRVSR
jgi:MerR family transcriptional regulator, copper efflux regulator